MTVRAPEPLPLLEEAISDLYLFVFDEEGNKRESLSRYYSREDLGLVYPFNQGGLSGITLPKGANMIYLIANVEASHNMDVSKVALDTIATEAQLKALEVKFKNVNQAPSNTGVRNNILMWGRANVDVYKRQELSSLVHHPQQKESAYFANILQRS